MMTRMLAALAATLSLSFSAWGQSLSIPAVEGDFPMYERSTALLIGVSDYEEWSSLDGVRRNVEDLKAFLERHDFQVTTLMDKGADDIRAAITDYLNTQVGENTRSIIYFAGHGWLNPQPQSRGARGFLVAKDTPSPAGIRGEAFSSFVQRMAQNALSDVEIRAFAEASRARHTLFLIDSCFSGAIFGQRSGFSTRIGQRLPSISFWESIARPAAQYLTIGNEYEKTPADSPFVDLFIEAVESGADVPDSPFVTASEVSMWVKRQLSPKGTLTPEWGWVLASGGEMVFRTGSPAAFAAPLSPQEQALADAADAPAETHDHSFGPVTVHYYRKASDGPAVLDALNALSAPYLVRSVSHDTPVNALGCHPDGDLALLKQLATALVESGVPLQYIREFSNPEDKPDRFDIYSARGSRSVPVLSPADIAGLEGCPLFFSAPQEAG